MSTFWEKKWVDECKGQQYRRQSQLASHGRGNQNECFQKAQDIVG